jgi:hypothetical protein
MLKLINVLTGGAHGDCWPTITKLWIQQPTKVRVVCKNDFQAYNIQLNVISFWLNYSD